MMMTALLQTLTPPKTKFWKFKEFKIKLKEGKFKEWTHKLKECTQKMKECTTKLYLLNKKDNAYIILPPSTKMTEEPIGVQWDVTT